MLISQTILPKLEDKPLVSLDQYLPELKRLKEAGANFVLVAGQAVNLWSLRFIEVEPRLKEFAPFVSKDVDLFGTFDDLYLIPKILEGELKRFRDMRTPVMGVFTTNSEPVLMFELLRDVYGPVLTDKIYERSVFVDGITVIDPISLLISKCHNAAGLDQEKRQDVRHVQMMVLSSYAHFLMISELIGNQITPRQFINECKYLLGFADNHVFQKGISMAGASLRDCFPVSAIQEAGNAHESVGRFLDNTLLPAC